MSTIKQIRTAIFNQINTLVSTDPLETNKPIAELSTYFKTRPEFFPAVQFEFNGDTWEVFTNVENERTIGWQIVIRQEYSSGDNTRENAIDTALGVYELLRDLLDVEWELDGVVIYSEPTDAEVSSIETANGYEYFITMTLLTKIIVDA